MAVEESEKKSGSQAAAAPSPVVEHSNQHYRQKLMADPVFMARISNVVGGLNFGSSSVYGSSYVQDAAPKKILPDHATDPRIAKQIILDELSLDGNPKLNLASFVTTYMEPEAEELMTAGMTKNFIDLDEYEQTSELHNRCVSMLANLFHAPPTPDGVPYAGTGTVGSSEAIMLSVLAMKWRWRAKRQEQGKPLGYPNIVCGSNVQVCWHKACRYFEVECREADVSPDCLVLTADRAKPLIDENTIGVCPILGSTFNGEFEDVKAIHDMLEKINEETGWDVPIHVDAASGGFVAPFTQPDLLWDFRLPLVKSINVSGHKFGLVYAGVGWAVWREPKDLPEDLVFHVNYLGGDQASFTLNFSKGAGNVIGQYYNLIRFGREGYTRIICNGMATSAYLREQIEKTGLFNIVDKAHMPLVAYSLKDTSRYSVYDIQDRMKQSGGWIVPAYTCSKGAEKLEIMRVVVKQNFTRDLADLFMVHLHSAIQKLEALHSLTKDLLMTSVSSESGVDEHIHKLTKASNKPPGDKHAQVSSKELAEVTRDEEKEGGADGKPKKDQSSKKNEDLPEPHHQALPALQQFVHHHDLTANKKPLRHSHSTITTNVEHRLSRRRTSGVC